MPKRAKKAKRGANKKNGSASPTRAPAGSTTKAAVAAAAAASPAAAAEPPAPVEAPAPTPVAAEAPPPVEDAAEAADTAEAAGALAAFCTDLDEAAATDEPAAAEEEEEAVADGDAALAAFCTELDEAAATDEPAAADEEEEAVAGGDAALAAFCTELDEAAATEEPAAEDADAALAAFCTELDEATGGTEAPEAAAAEPEPESDPSSSTAAQLSHRLARRPSLQEAQAVGAVKDRHPKECRTITAKKAPLEKKLVGRRLSALLDNKPDVDELHRAQILQPQGGRRMSARLQGVSRTLQRRMSETKVNDTLMSRPEVAELTQQNVVMSDATKLAPPLHAATHNLQKKMRADSVKTLLHDRPQAEQLSQWFGLDKGAIGKTDRVTVTGTALERKLVKSQIHRRLSATDRPNLDELVRAGILMYEEEEDQPFGTSTRPEDLGKEDQPARESADADAFSASDSQDGYPSRSGGVYFSMYSHDSRKRYAVALKAVGKLVHQAQIDQSGRATLKELILDDDARIFDAVDNFLSDQNFDRLLAALRYRLM